MYPIPSGEPDRRLQEPFAIGAAPYGDNMKRWRAVPFGACSPRARVPMFIARRQFVVGSVWRVITEEPGQASCKQQRFCALGRKLPLGIVGEIAEKRAV